MAKKSQEKAVGSRQKADDPGLATSVASEETEGKPEGRRQNAESAWPPDPLEIVHNPTQKIRGHHARQTVSIEVPLGPPPGDEYQSRHVDVQFRSAGQRATMRRIFTGLDLAGARTADGRRVTNNVEAVRWLIEQVAAAVESGE